MLKIWGRANSSNVQKVLWCCEELGIGYERIDAGGAFGRTKDPDYLAMNPNGLVPTVQDGDVVIWESNTILRYLATTRGGARLYPTNPGPRTQVERWMDWQLATVTAPMTDLLFGLVRKIPPATEPARIEAARKRGHEVFGILERQLAKSDYVAGSSLTLADICLGIFGYRWLNFPIEREKMPALEAWYQRLAQRPGFATHIMQPIT
jgi:glutathione S-transferase